ncbi:hypothetical protein Tco_0900586, partial [Tanacetum coccineum]
KPKVTKEKPSNPSHARHPKRDKVQKIRKGKSPLQLIDEDEPTQPKPEPEHQGEGEGEEYDVERAIQMSLESFQAKGQSHVGGVAIRVLVAEATRPLPVVEGKGKEIATEEQAAQSLLALYMPKRRSTTDQFIFQRRTPATKEASTGPSAQPEDDTSANIVRDSPSPADAETGADTDKTNSGGDTEILQIGEEQGQAGSDPGKTSESQPPPERVLMKEDQTGPDPGLNEEHVHEENPLSSNGTLSSMKNLDAFNFDDQFFNDKPTEEDPGKTNIETEVESMVTVPIHQVSSSVPPLSTPVINLSPPKPVPSTTQAPTVFTATTTTTTTTLTLPPPPQQQSITDSELAARVTTLEKKFSDLEQKSKNLDNMTHNLGSRVFTLELQDLPYKINQTVNEVVKEAVHVAFQAPL